jgi:hypothetical protein
MKLVNSMCLLTSDFLCYSQKQLVATFRHQILRICKSLLSLDMLKHLDVLSFFWGCRKNKSEVEQNLIIL